MDINEKQHNIKISKGKPLPLGVSLTGEGVQLSVFVPDRQECRLRLYEKGKTEPFQVVTLDESFRMGGVFSVLLEKIDGEGLEYVYETDNEEFSDPYAVRLTGRETWNGSRTKRFGSTVRCGFVTGDFNWEGDKNPETGYEDMILYQLHVRGFTKHGSSQTEGRGTFHGIKEKIGYLKDLGVNAILVLPCYEFDELMQEEQQMAGAVQISPARKINYWGYGKNCSYFAPKTAYCMNKNDPAGEMKDLIRELHRNGMEFIMEICFEQGTGKSLVIDCLRYWKLEYHVDGFKINDNFADTVAAATDPVLYGVKLLTARWDTEKIYEDKYVPSRRNLAEYNEGFMTAARRFLKSDEDSVPGFLDGMKKNMAQCANINFMDHINGFTLADLVSYDVRHNDKNGEEGRDGNPDNYSWNCGAEGRTRRKMVLSLRKQQIRNAIVMLFLSQGAPMILAGDEFGNSAGGNNNAWCQDNLVSWLNWNQMESERDSYEFMKSVIMFRKEHPIFHMPTEFQVMDYISCGYPDISFHGTKAWYPDFSRASRALGIMLCGRYARADENYFYLAFNMHWEPHEFDLPKLPAGMEWNVVLDTASDNNTIVMPVVKQRNVASKRKKKLPEPERKRYMVSARSIIVFTAG